MFGTLRPCRNRLSLRLRAAPTADGDLAGAVPNRVGGRFTPVRAAGLEPTEVRRLCDDAVLDRTGAPASDGRWRP